MQKRQILSDSSFKNTSTTKSGKFHTKHYAVIRIDLHAIHYHELTNRILGTFRLERTPYRKTEFSTARKCYFSLLKKLAYQT
jgi:hypothetical protein